MAKSTSPKSVITTSHSKRSHSSSLNSEPSTSPQMLQHVNKKKSFSSKNRYEILTPTDSSDEPIIEKMKTTAGSSQTSDKPHPPVIVEFDDFPGFRKELIELIGVHKLTTEHPKIQTKYPETYRTLVHYLKNEKSEFYKHQLKEDKPTRVVISDLDLFTPSDIVECDLKLRVNEVKRVTQVIHKVGKIFTPLFFADLDQIDHSNEIIQLKSLLHTNIEKEETHKPRAISEFQNCQEYNFTKRYWENSPPYVQCGDDHFSTACPNLRQDPMEYALNSGNHSANYKGCVVYKDLHKRKEPNINN